MNYGKVNLSGKFNPPTFQDTRISVYGYLLISDERKILVDTGVGVGNSYIDQTFEPEHPDIAAQLSEFGLEPQEIDTVINTHLHFDHCGNNRLFTSSEIFVQQDELTAAEEKFYTLKEWFDYPDARIKALAGDTKNAEGVQVILTPGHTPGHQSVLVESTDGAILIAAQVAFSSEEFKTGGNPKVQGHEGFAEAYCDSISRLKMLGARRILFSHDDTDFVNDKG